MSILILDLEVENHKLLGALASPRHPDNYVVAIGQAIDNQPFDGEIKHEYYASKADAVQWLSIPEDVTLLVAHNAAFEMDWMLCQEREEIMRFLRRGGRVFCTAYAEYLLSNQQSTYPSLDETAPNYGGSHKVDGIKILWEQGKLTSEIDQQLLLEYLIGPNGDIENTRKVFYGQHAALVARGMWDMALVRMEGLLSNVFCMDAGLYVDREVAFSQLEVQNQRIAELQAGFSQYRTHIPGYVNFKDSSDYHVSAWLFGGPIKYKIKDTWFNDDGTPKYEKAECYKFGEQFVILKEEEPRITPEEFESAIKQHGAVAKATAGKLKGRPRVYKVEVSTPKQRWYDRVFDCTGVVPLESLPQDIYKDFKHEFAGKRTLADNSPVFSSGKDCIQMLSLRQEFPEGVRDMLVQMLEYAKLDKDVGTYYLRDTLDEEGNVTKQSGMLQYLTPENIVYHILNCTATVTSRLSSNRPNMQNIPRGDTSEVKKMFTSRFGADGQIIEADYSALEVVTLAAFSKDENLTKALLDGIDMHCMRLSQQLKEPYEDVLKKCHDDTQVEHKAYKTLRTNIKPKAFAYQYGATAQGIAFSTGCTVEEAQSFIDAEKSLFPGVESFYDDVITPYVDQHTTVCREQGEDGSWHLYRRGVWQSPGGTCYEFRQFPKVRWINGQRIEGYEFKPTQLRNYPIQGESGYFVQGVAGLVIRWLISKNFFDGKCLIINQVHDALYFDCHKSVLDEVCFSVKHIMESLPQYFGTLGYDLGVPFPVEVEHGDSMYKKTKWSLA